MPYKTEYKMIPANWTKLSLYGRGPFAEFPIKTRCLSSGEMFTIQTVLMIQDYGKIQIDYEDATIEDVQSLLLKDNSLDFSARVRFWHEESGYPIPALVTKLHGGLEEYLELMDSGKELNWLKNAYWTISEDNSPTASNGEIVTAILVLPAFHIKPEKVRISKKEAKEIKEEQLYFENLKIFEKLLDIWQEKQRKRVCFIFRIRKIQQAFKTMLMENESICQIYYEKDSYKPSFYVERKYGMSVNFDCNEFSFQIIQPFRVRLTRKARKHLMSTATKHSQWETFNKEASEFLIKETSLNTLLEKIRNITFGYKSFSEVKIRCELDLSCFFDMYFDQDHEDFESDVDDNESFYEKKNSRYKRRTDILLELLFYVEPKEKDVKRDVKLLTEILGEDCL